MSAFTLPRLARRGAVVGAALAAAIALTACGSSSSGSTTTSPATSAAATSADAASDTASSGSAAAGTSAASKPLRIGFSPFTLQVPALKGLADGLTAVAKAQGDTVVTADPKGDPTTQLQQLQQWVQLGQVDAIWVIPSSAATVAPVIKQAQNKGIVVVASGVPADYGLTEGAPGVTFTNVDNADFGNRIGTLTAQCVTQRLGGNGKVIFLSSPTGAQSTAAINTAIKDALAKGAPNATIVNTQIAKDRLGSQQEVSSALQGSPDANSMIGSDDESTLGGLAAFQQAGKDPKSICIVGAGGNDEAVAAVKAGNVFADVAFDFQSDLMQNLQNLHAMAADPKAPGKQLVTPIKTFTADAAGGASGSATATSSSS